MSDLYNKKIVIKDLNSIDKEINISCLGGKHLPKIFKIAKVLSGTNEENVFEKLDDESMNTLVDLCVRSLVIALPDAKEEEIEKMVTINFTKLINAVLEVNVPRD